MNHKLAKYILFYPLRFLRGEPIYKAITEVNDFNNGNNVKEAQWLTLHQLLMNTYDSIPFYKKTWDFFNVNPTMIKDIKDFSKLPFLTKDIVSKNQNHLRNPQINKYDHRSTSGSTGTPLEFIKDRYATAYLDAVMYHSYSWYGIDIGDKQVRFWGMPEDSKGKNIAKIKDFLMNRTRLSAFNLNDETFSSFIRKIEKARPDYFYGYPSMMYLFASYLKENNISLKGLALKLIICTGEQLFDDQRKIIQDSFQTRVINEYGCTEVGVIGFECPHGNMHEMSSNIYLEIIKERSQVIDEEGEICVTELHSKTSPFIRYKINDRGILFSKKCECGLPFPVFKVLSGRIDDFIITPEGKKVYDAILAYTMKKGVTCFKAIQTGIKKLDIYLVTNDLYNKDLEKSYHDKFKKGISPNMDYIFHYVNEISPEKSGKLCYFRSEIHR